MNTLQSKNKYTLIYIHVNVFFIIEMLLFSFWYFSDETFSDKFCLIINILSVDRSNRNNKILGVFEKKIKF